MKAGEIIDRCLHLGVNALELRSQPVEEFLGSPDKSVYSAAAPEQIGARSVTAGEISRWRATAPMDKAHQCRQKFEGAGIAIEIMKVDDIYVRTDEELDYFFRLAKTLGSRAISCEISDPLDDTSDAVWPATRNGSRATSNRTGTPSTSQSSSPAPLTSKKSTSRRPPDQ